MPRSISRDSDLTDVSSTFVDLSAASIDLSVSFIDLSVSFIYLSAASIDLSEAFIDLSFTWVPKIFLSAPGDSTLNLRLRTTLHFFGTYPKTEHSTCTRLTAIKFSSIYNNNFV